MITNFIYVKKCLYKLIASEWRDDMASIYWLVVFLILLGVEIGTLGLTTIWFAIGSLAAFITTLFDAKFIVQIVVFLVVSILTLIFVRPFFKKYLDKGKVNTNIDEVIGKTAMVTKAIMGAGTFGEANLDGEIWMIKSENNELIKENEIVEIVSVEGVKLVVRRKDERK